jgi:LysR family transcriptional activator of nhaA
VLADEPASSSANFKTFNHPLGDSGTTFCAEKKLAANLKRGFPESLHNAPALLPAESTPFRRTLDTWFGERRLQPRVVAEFEDLALMKVMAAEGRGFIAVPSVASPDAVEHYGFQILGEAPDCRVSFHAITAERRTHHPAASAITAAAKGFLEH